MENVRKKIVMVDDDITILNIGKNALIDKYDIFTIPSGDKLFKLLERVTPDLILLDIEMPVMNGYEIIKILKSRESTEQIPVIFLTAMTDTGSELEGLSLGAIDYITKPFSPLILLKRIDVHMLVESQRKSLKEYNDNLEKLVREKTRTVLELQSATLKTIAELVECRDDVTGGHIERTQGYLMIFIDILLKDDVYREEISSWDIDLFILSALLHDVGKIAIKDSILLKPSRLNTDEFEEMKNHTILGAKVIQKIKNNTHENAFLKYAETLASTHHEKWDGTGYPLGLKGEDIPLQGRIMAIIDVYDALINDRPYKKAMSHDEAIAVIESEKGTHFDPRLIDAFVSHAHEFGDVELVDSKYPVITREKDEIINELHSMVSQTIAEIVNYRDNSEDMDSTQISRVEIMPLCMKIMLDALLKHEKYKDVVASWDTDLFLLSAELHDVGKISIRDDILLKPSKLTEKEFAEIKTHTDYGVEVVKKIWSRTNEDVFLFHAESIAGSHHERWDGSGYPHGYIGEQIPLQGRLMAIVDVYSALTSARPYKEILSHEEAVEIIRSGAGLQFDPNLVEVFLEHEVEIRNARNAIQNALTVNTA